MEIRLAEGEAILLVANDDDYSLKVNVGKINIHKNNGRDRIRVEKRESPIGYGQFCYSIVLD